MGCTVCHCYPDALPSVTNTSQDMDQEILQLNVTRGISFGRVLQQVCYSCGTLQISQCGDGSQRERHRSKPNSVRSTCRGFQPGSVFCQSRQNKVPFTCRSTQQKPCSCVTCPSYKVSTDLLSMEQALQCREQGHKLKRAEQMTEPSSRYLRAQVEIETPSHWQAQLMDDVCAEPACLRRFCTTDHPSQCNTTEESSHDSRSHAPERVCEPLQCEHL